MVKLYLNLIFSIRETLGILGKCVRNFICILRDWTFSGCRDLSFQITV